MQSRLSPEQHDTIEGIREPAENPHFFGHEAEARRIAEAYRSGRLHHALVFAGPYGIGKATLAFRVARHLLANPDPARAPGELVSLEPESPIFRQVAQGAHPAVLCLTRPANDKTKGFRSAITVDEVRRIGRLLSTTVHDGGYRVVIVDPAGDMNTNAANALLKSLEEPPARTLFILIAHSAGRLLPTIRSRCQILRLHPLGPEALVRALEAADVALPDDPRQRDALVARSQGSVRNALLLTHYGGLEIAEAIGGVLGEKTYPVPKAARLADAVAGRDQGVQFEIFNERMLDIVAGGASDAAARGDAACAAGLADLWDRLRQALSDLETYNLDKRHHVMSVLASVHATLAR